MSDKNIKVFSLKILRNFYMATNDSSGFRVCRFTICYIADVGPQKSIGG